jgi:tetratricopeptide (TPR) repeat protein
MAEIYFTYFNRGNAYYHKDDYKNALPDLDTAISLNPKYARPYLLRGAIYSELEERDKAISDLQTAIDLGLIPNEEQQAKALLDKLRK